MRAIRFIRLNSSFCRISGAHPSKVGETIPIALIDLNSAFLHRQESDPATAHYLTGLNLTPGPSPAMNTIARTAAAIIHARLSSISGICNSLLRMRGPWSKIHIHASPECPPKDAAAAETKIKSGPTGLSAPAAQERTPPVI